MRESASRGFWVSSYAPFGYNRVMVQDGPKKRPTLQPDPDASRVVKRIFDMAEAGNGMVNITRTLRTLNDEGISSPKGKLWGKTSVHAILINESYTGTLVWGTNSKDKAEPVRVEKAFPAIVTKAQFSRVNKLMRSRAPKMSHPRRVGSTYLLSGLVKCKTCNRALSGQDAKSGQFAYYVCQSIMKRGKDACDTPRLNARRFEELVVDKIRSNILTEGSITELVKVVDEEMDGIARDQRKRLRVIEDELEDVKRRLGRIWNVIETSDVDMADASDRIKEHRERKERLEDAAADARAILSERRAHLDDVKTISAYAKDMRDFLNESELTERRAFIESFVKEIIVMPGDALMRYTVPMPDDSLIPGRATEKVALNGSVLSTVHDGGPPGIRTQNLRIKSPLLYRVELAAPAPLYETRPRGETATERLSALEARRPLLDERLRTLLGVLGRPGDSHPHLRVVEGRVEVHVQHVVGHALGHLGGDPGAVGQRSGKLQRLAHQGVRRNDAGQVAYAQRLLGVDDAGRPHQLQRTRHADDPRQEVAAGIPRHNPHETIRHPEPGLVRCESQVGHGGHIHAGARRRPVDRSDVGLVQGGQHPRNAVHRIPQAVPGGNDGIAGLRGEHIALGERFRIGAGAEGPPRSGNHHGSDAGVVPGILQSHPPAVDHVRRKSVEPVRPVQRNDGHAIVLGIQQVLVIGHFEAS